MLTIFAVPKPFRGRIAQIQRNAIQSWTKLDPKCEVLLIGDDQGTAELAAELGTRHLTEVSRNEYGTPLVNSVFTVAERAATSTLLCYVNADVILLSDFLPAIQRVQEYKPHSLIVGRRWDLDVNETLTFEAGWEKRLRLRLRSAGRLHAHTGLDYFVFSRGLWERIPAFAIGRFAWDSWLVYAAHRRGIPIVDLGTRITVIHQNHPLVQASTHATGEREVEIRRNLELAGGISHAYTLLDAQYVLTASAVRRRFTPYAMYRSIVSLSESNSAARRLLALTRFLRRLA